MANLSPTLEQAFLVANRATEETLNSNPDGCNQHTGPGCSLGGGNLDKLETAVKEIRGKKTFNYGKGQSVSIMRDRTKFYGTRGRNGKPFVASSVAEVVSHLTALGVTLNAVSSSTIETLLANVSGKTRRETLNGREYIVAPVRMIVEGVLNGSKGALFYPQPEINRDYQAWNGMPIVVYHPTNDRGEPVSARSAKVLNKSGIGMVLESKTESGPLDAEGWFDVDATKRVDNRVYERLLAGKPIELSTGLFTDNHPAPRGATFNGKPYAYVARNYRPDHLAVLPDQKGACSLNDGCGVLINKTDGETTLNKLWTQFKTLFNRLDEVANPTENSNPEGCNQHTGPECSGSSSESKNGKGQTTEWMGLKAEYTGETETRTRGGKTRLLYEVVITDEKAVKGVMKGHKKLSDKKPKITDNALPNQPKSLSTGKFKSMNAGLGKGEAHEAAQRGNLTLTERDGELGVEARQQFDSGGSPPSWVVDESKWERAKTEADKGNYEGDTYWSAVARIYQNIGGEIKSSTTNSNPEGCNQHTGPGCSGGLNEVVHKFTSVSSLTGEKHDLVVAKTPDGKYFVTRADFAPTQHATDAKLFDTVKSALKGHESNDRWIHNKSQENNEEMVECNGEEDCECPECKAKVTENEDDHSGSSSEGDSLEGEPDMAKLTENDRKKLVDGLVTNCSCQTANIWKEDDRETLNELNDDKLVALTKQRKSMLDAEAVVNTVKGVEAFSGLTVNEMPAALKKAMDKKKSDPDDDEEDDEDEEEVPVKGKKPVANESRLTPEEKEDLAYARRAKSQRKEQIINQLIVNVAEEDRAIKIKSLQAKPLAALEEMLEYIPTRNEDETEQRSVPLYYGVGDAAAMIGRLTGNRRANFDEDDILPIPTVNWEEEYTNQRKKASSNAD